MFQKERITRIFLSLELNSNPYQNKAKLFQCYLVTVNERFTYLEILARWPKMQIQRSLLTRVHCVRFIIIQKHYPSLFFIFCFVKTAKWRTITILHVIPSKTEFIATL